MSSRKESRRGAFTLIELLVVIAIIALLVSILVPSLRAARELASNAKCKNNVKNMGTGLHFYFNDFNDWLPPSSAGDGTTYWWQWADAWVHYFDSSAKACKTANAGSGPWVNFIPASGVMDNPAKQMSYSRVLDCPSQKNDNQSEYSWNARYSWTDPFGTWTTPSSGPGGHRWTWYKRPSEYCQIMDAGPTATRWMRSGFNFGGGNTGQVTEHAMYAPHFKSVNALMLDGHVKVILGTEILPYCDRQGVNFTGLPFGQMP